MKHLPVLAGCIIVLFLSAGCQEQKNSQTEEKEPTLFTLLTPEKTHVDFQNIINEGLNTNVLMYEYFYNGGGVAVGDLNGDKLDDLYFTANLSANKLYLNKGKMEFEDITDASGAAGREGPWKTGVTMADVNGDGKLDIFVCHSGNLPPEKKANELFINQGNNAQGIPSFREQAADYGLDTPSSSTNAYFFDYDRDGDLDLFLLNHNIKSLPVLNESNTIEFNKTDDSVSGSRLFRNEGQRFTDVTQKAGINSSPLSYGLGAGIADFNQDGWPDIYVSNDYTIPDRLYINTGKGGFTDQLPTSIGHTSHFSMGNDVADVNNDAHPDIFTLDMLPEENRRQKLLMAPDNYEKFDMMVRSGFHKQFMRNMLQLNQGISSQKTENRKSVDFSEIGQLAGISNTDWSWAALFADYDNDGWKDLYITNGYLRDYTNLDFLKYMNDFQQNQPNIGRQDVLNLVQQMPASNVVNYLYKNNKDLTFKNVGIQWGLGQNSNSNGAVYADLDNDGDLDLVVNNVNQPAFIYQNEARQLLKNHYLKVTLAGGPLNRSGIGAKVILYQKGQTQYLEQMPMRGYQSSVSGVLHFGLGTATTIDSLKVQWPNGKQQRLTNVKGDQWLTLNQTEANESITSTTGKAPLFGEIPSPVAFAQPESAYNDFKRQILMVNPQSYVGPALAKADVNGDGLDDVFVGGGNGQAGALFLQQKGGNGSYTKKMQPAFEGDSKSDAADAQFFDANGDGSPDLYVCHGGYANFEANDPLLQDALYLNDGKGNFTKNTSVLPSMPVSTSCVRVADINGDKRPDLFVGGRVVPGSYPEIPPSFILLNDGKGNFKDATASLAPELQKIGMVTDAAWLDLNGDKKPELIVVGEWMPVTVFENVNGKLENKTDNYFDRKYSGWWNKLLVDDFNGDGKMDLAVGNLGLNSQVKASAEQPAELYFKDFDQNGRIDPILCTYIQGKSYPYVTRDELIGQLPIMGKRYSDYKTYSEATLKDIFTESELEGATRLEANHLATTLFEQGANGKFVVKKLPAEVQASPIHALISLDYDKDGKKDLLVCGNQLRTRLRFGHYDANFGTLLHNNGNGTFSYVPQQKSGFQLTGEVRSILNVNDKLYFGINQQKVTAYSTK
ncbi:VCBS repeat-containing protein [Runella slithyformis]|uniref:ASPIC/UnbV domain protein n=1 Tax=Runella slithyformis (strain ATCC 29530 / DSM 19594 / LMG 11500 / NCIMB 11436 / LSU 4) TaxID=761193 RepID=A0A7U3ZMJ6_RUNSL|nr:VCBS repeat-containing protein [Runella slithyformis]AEI49980.1 ASPIC/UnbV domain protein [Runella slithyformis DSM 19594]